MNLAANPTPKPKMKKHKTRPKTDRNYTNSGCILLLGAVLNGTRPRGQLLPTLMEAMRTAISMDSLNKMTPQPTHHNYVS